MNIYVGNFYHIMT